MSINNDIRYLGRYSQAQPSTVARSDDDGPKIVKVT